MTTTDEITAPITKPGLHAIGEQEYHDDPALSASGAHDILPPNTPAHYQYKRAHPEVKREFDFGSAAHMRVLGAGPDIEVVHADDWRTKAAKEQRDYAREAGRVPLLAREVEVVDAMAEKLREHPVASRLFEPGSGTAEQSLFFRDEPTGVMLRARLDWLPHKVEGKRLIVPDYKTAVSASDEAISKASANYGYALKGAWYLDAVTALGIDDDPAFLLVTQEKTPPYLVNIAQLDVVALRIGRTLKRQAIDLYAHCLANNEWPGYGSDIKLINLPPYVENKHREESPLA